MCFGSFFQNAGSRLFQIFFFFQAWLSRIGSANRQRSEISKGGAHERDYSFGWRISGVHCRTAKVSSVEQLIPLSPYTMICSLDFAAGQMLVSFSQVGSAVLLANRKIWRKSALSTFKHWVRPSGSDCSKQSAWRIEIWLGKRDFAFWTLLSISTCRRSIRSRKRCVRQHDAKASHQCVEIEILWPSVVRHREHKL